VIGTNLTNDAGCTALNVVMTLARCNEQPVARIADKPGKTLCDTETSQTCLCQAFSRGAA